MKYINRDFSRCRKKEECINENQGRLTRSDYTISHYRKDGVALYRRECTKCFNQKVKERREKDRPEIVTVFVMPEITDPVQKLLCSRWPFITSASPRR